MLFRHIHENGLKKGIYIDCVNGFEEHVHCLFRLRNDQTIMKCLQLLKGESSFWVNQNNFLEEKLIWQKEHFAISVSESVVPRVRKYIHNQERHHKKQSWEDEYQQLITKYKFQTIKG